MSNQEQVIGPEDLPQCTGAILSSKHHPEDTATPYYIDAKGQRQNLEVLPKHLALINALRQGETVRALDPESNAIIQQMPMFSLLPEPPRSKIFKAINSVYPYTSRRRQMQNEMSMMAAQVAQGRAHMKAQLMSSIRHGVARLK